MKPKPPKYAYDLSIIIPSYKEADIIGPNLEKLAAFLKSRDFGRVEVLVVSNCPEDTAKAAAKKAKLFENFRIVDEKNRLGKGGAVRLGMFEAQGKYRLFMDTDLATPLHHLEELQQRIAQGHKVIIGVRDPEKVNKGNPLRKLVAKIANLATRLIVIPGVIDTQCGFKCFEAQAAIDVFGRQTITGWSFDVEILAIARKLGYKINNISIDDWHDPKVVGLVGDSVYKIMIKEGLQLFKIRFMLLTGKYSKPTYKHDPAAVNYCPI